MNNVIYILWSGMHFNKDATVITDSWGRYLLHPL